MSDAHVRSWKNWNVKVAALHALGEHVTQTLGPDAICPPERRKPLERPALLRLHASKRRAAKLKRTPPWADLDAMRAIYAEAQRLTRETGIPHHVDHEIPLQGRIVSGLHVHNNLQILTGSENSKKRNHYEIDE